MAEGRSRVIDQLITRFLFRTDTRALSGLERRIAVIRQRLDGVSRGLFRMGAVAAVPFAKIAKTAVDTDAALRQLEARSKANADEMERFKLQAYEVGSVLPLTTSDIIRAQTAFYQLGFTIDEVFTATPAISRFAAAMKIQVEDAARYAAVALNTFKEDASALDRILGEIAKAETLTPSTAQQIGESFQYSASTAAAAGLNTAEYISILGNLGKSGRDIESASQGLSLFLTQIDRGLSGFGRGQKIVTEAFEALDISMEEVRGTMRGLPGDFTRLLNLMRERAGQLPRERLTAALAALSGTTYASAFRLLIQDANEIPAVTDKIADSMTELEAQTRLRMRGISGAWTQFRAMVDTLENVLADVGISGPVESLLRNISGVIGELVRQEEVVDSAGRRVKRYANEDLLVAISTTLRWGVSLLAAGAAVRVLSWTLGGFAGIIRFVRWTIAAGAAVRLWSFAVRYYAVTEALPLFSRALAFVMGRLRAFFALVRAHGVLGVFSMAVRGMGSAMLWAARAAVPAMIAGLRGLTVAIVSVPILGWIAGIITALGVLWYYWDDVSGWFRRTWLGRILLGDEKPEPVKFSLEVDVPEERGGGGLFGRIGRAARRVAGEISDDWNNSWGRVFEDWNEMGSMWSAVFVGIWTDLAHKFRGEWEVLTTVLGGAWEHLTARFREELESWKAAWDSAVTWITESALFRWLGDIWDRVAFLPQDVGPPAAAGDTAGGDAPGVPATTAPVPHPTALPGEDAPLSPFLQNLLSPESAPGVPDVNVAPQVAVSVPPPAGGRSLSFNVERLEVNVQEGDADEIASRATGAMERRFHDMVENVDSAVWR